MADARVVVVTGAGTGVGKATAIELMKRGHAVVLAGRRAEPLRQVAAAIDAPGRALAVPTDVADPASVRRLFDRAVDAFGRVDVLFNNAGAMPQPCPLEDLPTAQWRHVVEVNLTGMFLCIQQAFRVMKTQSPRGGRIINNGSTAAHVPRPDSIAYTASKHAVTGLTRSASLDGRKYDIACGQIDIGNAATEMAAAFAGGVLQAHGERAVEPLMDVVWVARAVAQMAELPLEANVLFQTLVATKMPFVGRG